MYAMHRSTVWVLKLVTDDIFAMSRQIGHWIAVSSELWQVPCSFVGSLCSSSSCCLPVQDDRCTCDLRWCEALFVPGLRVLPGISSTIAGAKWECEENTHVRCSRYSVVGEPEHAVPFRIEVSVSGY